jgi:hypothetical protein
MSQEFEELEVAEFTTGFAASRNLLIASGGMISGSSIVDVKVSTVEVRPNARAFRWRFIKI